ncbi:hypothetical protein MRX96_039276 [Rhipicephalus microplus]
MAVTPRSFSHRFRDGTGHVQLPEIGRPEEGLPAGAIFPPPIKPSFLGGSSSAQEVKRSKVGRAFCTREAPTGGASYACLDGGRLARMAGVIPAASFYAAATTRASGHERSVCPMHVRGSRFRNGRRTCCRKWEERRPSGVFLFRSSLRKRWAILRKVCVGPQVTDATLRHCVPAPYRHPQAADESSATTPSARLSTDSGRVFVMGTLFAFADSRV